jgi:hypothetical protein
MIAVVGVFLGMASSNAKVSFDIRVHIAVYTVAFFNFMFLSIQPRLMIERQAAKATGKPNPDVGAIVRNVLAGNWHRAALLVLLLWEASILRLEITSS